MRTIEFTDEDIKECKLALLRQDLTSLQSAFLMQYITNLEQALNEIKEICYGSDMSKQEYEKVLQIIDKVGGNG